MVRWVPALAILLASGAWAAPPVVGQQPAPEGVAIQADGITLHAQFVQPAGAPKAPSVIALHGCGGPWPRRDRQWQSILTAAGHQALFPDSFGSRGLGSQCKNPDRTVRPGRERRADAVAAVTWLAAQPATPPGGVVVMGWSNGGSTVLAAAAQGVMPPGLVRGFIALYPGCRVYTERRGWAPSAPILILMGESDDWTPAEPCHVLAERFPDRVTIVTYPDTYHDFDVPGYRLRVRSGLAYTAGRNGAAHTGSNEASRDDAIRRVLAFLDTPMLQTKP